MNWWAVAGAVVLAVLLVTFFVVWSLPSKPAPPGKATWRIP